jgi:hypothetical protein
VDHKERYCAGFQDSLQPFGAEEVSVRDIFLKDDHDRFRWFIDNTETAYNMFLDLVEKMVYEDFDDGLLDSEYNIVDADIDVDPVEDTEDTEADKRSEEISKAWDMYSHGDVYFGG